ncbi:olfactory receptor [Cricetulus griseus]|uniref:Olfactory receptor n=1 Tax=Cricetulus griseus TaxID=10029 RepID=A0A061I3T4_CRIGR|nr:olfactory receptor [Cricetulus griseus]
MLLPCCCRGCADLRALCCHQGRGGIRAELLLRAMSESMGKMLISAHHISDIGMRAGTVSGGPDAHLDEHCWCPRNIDAPNFTYISEFSLMGLTDDPELEPVLFGLFLFMYLVAVLGNLIIVLAVSNDPNLHTPMYFFL